MMHHAYGACIHYVSECLRKVHLAMLLRILRKSVCVIGTGGSCMPNLHTLYHPSQTLGQGRGATPLIVW